MDNLDSIKSEFEDIKKALDIKNEIKTLYEEKNKLINNCSIQSNRITIVEKDVVNILEKQLKYEKTQEELKTTLNNIEKGLMTQSMTTENISDSMTKFITKHEQDAPKAIKAMKKLVSTTITVSISLLLCISGFIAWQSRIILKNQDEKIELIFKQSIPEKSETLKKHKYDY